MDKNTSTNTLTALTQLETSFNELSIDRHLRCQICNKYYELPVSTKCQHTFCAGCLKCNFENKATAMECPICGYWFTSFAQMCKNSIIEDFVKEYEKMRSLITQLYKQGLEVKTDKTIVTPESCELSNNYGECNNPSKRIKFETREQENIYNNVENCNKHVDKKPKVVYALLKDKALKDELRKEGLSAQGTREELIRRHAHYLNLWNSNVDATKRKDRVELLKEMVRWEKAQRSGDAKGVVNIKKSLINEDDAKSYDILDYCLLYLNLSFINALIFYGNLQIRYHDQFTELIKQAKKGQK
ncbi:12652_t:CDS:2 [Cetraspora pellucida]|uniref:Postreplication repair E3 ubiquitin-protein ligase RAD18 n=1 Tax=Cetraspora pellucida TaxID=1433469 RepID=A0A9N9A8L9_9GLOM|nr:12652_t:CDS:2 [Cetraspora pellucida]